MLGVLGLLRLNGVLHHQQIVRPHYLLPFLPTPLHLYSLCFTVSRSFSCSLFPLGHTCAVSTYACSHRHKHRSRGKHRAKHTGLAATKRNRWHKETDLHTRRTYAAQYTPLHTNDKAQGEREPRQHGQTDRILRAPRISERRILPEEPTRMFTDSTTSKKISFLRYLIPSLPTPSPYPRHTSPPCPCQSCSSLACVLTSTRARKVQKRDEHVTTVR